MFDLVEKALAPQIFLKQVGGKAKIAHLSFSSTQ